MSLKLKLSVLALIAAATPAMAADVPNLVEVVKGVWSTADGCNRLKLSKINPKVLWEPGFEDITYLDGKGIEGYEWSCRFLKGMEGKGGENVYLSECEVEGESWTDLLMVEKIDAGGWTVTALDGNNQPNTIVYDTMCKGSK